MRLEAALTSVAGYTRLTKAALGWSGSLQQRRRVPFLQQLMLLVLYKGHKAQLAQPAVRIGVQMDTSMWMIVYGFCKLPLPVKRVGGAGWLDPTCQCCLLLYYHGRSDMVEEGRPELCSLLAAN